jgi:hypothetical protein
MKLSKISIEIENLLLDPNNPRFADISDESLNIPFTRFSDTEIQKNAFNKMMNPRFDVISLANSIETVGFVPVDNIVTKKCNGSSLVVVEGNRRVTAIKHIINQYKIGQSLLTEDKINELSVIDVLVIDTVEDETESIGKIIQGIRNVSGIKEWDAYQKAQFISEMIEKGKAPGVISKMIGMSVKDINRYYKTYSAMSQFKSDDEYSSKWKHSYFSYFDEVLKRPVLRTYLGWEEEKFLFMNQNNLHRFYDWIVPEDETPAAITDARDVRYLVSLVGEEKSLIYLDEKNLQKAINLVEQKNFNTNKITLPDCIERINSAIEAFKNIIAEGLDTQMSKEDIEEVSKSIDSMKNQINRIKILKESES